MEMKSVKGTQTECDLLAAFAGESQARTRYTFYAEKAAMEGYQQIAEVFRVTSDQELSHAMCFFRLLEGGTVKISAGYPAGVIGTTRENLAVAAAGEREEWSDLYTGFAVTASAEGFPHIAALYRNIANVEIMHEQRFLRLLDRLISGTLFESAEAVKWQCRRCGFTLESTRAPRVCPICGMDHGWFERV
jgi:rubrerythrin